MQGDGIDRQGLLDSIKSFIFCNWGILFRKRGIFQMNRTL